MCYAVRLQLQKILCWTSLSRVSSKWQELIVFCLLGVDLLLYVILIALPILTVSPSVTGTRG